MAIARTSMAMDRIKLIRHALWLLPILALLALLLAALFLAGDASSDVSQLGAWSGWLFGASACAVGLLVGIIAGQIVALVRRQRARTVGAKLAARLTWSLIALTVPPLILVYGFALRFLYVSIDSWFDVRIEQALDDALSLGQAYLDREERQARENSKNQISLLQHSDVAQWQIRLEQALDQIQALQLVVFSSRGAVIANAVSDPQYLIPKLPEGGDYLQLQEGAIELFTEVQNGKLRLRALGKISDEYWLQAVFSLPEYTQPLVQRIESSHHNYQRLKFLRTALKQSFALILTLVLLLALLLTVLAALRIARKQVAPIAQLAEATKEIAIGHYGRAVPSQADDEIGFLTQSFNEMSKELELASQRARESQFETERQRAYLGMVLERLTTGVVTFSRSGILRTTNAAASRILGIQLASYIGTSVEAISQHCPWILPVVRLMLARVTEGVHEWREELQLTREYGPQTLMLRGTGLPTVDPDQEPGYILVFDDETVLNQAQREAAWSEVARRLAHEVKNPLTPIQLAAERIWHRLGQKLTPEDAQLLKKSTQTIVAQVGALKTMVNAFGDYARPQRLQMTRWPLNQLVDEVLDLYEHNEALCIVRLLSEKSPEVYADRDRMRQVLHNLIKNAIEASSADIVIEIGTCEEWADDRRQILFWVADRGAGLPEHFDERWYEPYRTGKQEGMGLGLAVARKVAEEHGGSVVAANRGGGGAVFTITLPQQG